MWTKRGFAARKKKDRQDPFTKVPPPLLLAAMMSYGKEPNGKPLSDCFKPGGINITESSEKDVLGRYRKSCNADDAGEF